MNTRSEMIKERIAVMLCTILSVFLTALILVGIAGFIGFFTDKLNISDL